METSCFCVSRSSHFSDEDPVLWPRVLSRPPGSLLHGYNSGMDLTSNSRLGRLLRLPLRLVPSGLEVPVLCGPMRGVRWLVGTGDHGCWLGTYERVKQRILSEQLRPGMVFYDVGANVGIYSLLAWHRGCRVFAFEPEPRNFAALSDHIRLNHADVTARQLALSDYCGEGHFAGGNSTGRLSTDGCVVQVATADSLDTPAPDVLKIDVEGAEFSVLRGCEHILSHKPVIFLATHGPDVHRQCCELLQHHGYAIKTLGEGEVMATAERTTNSLQAELAGPGTRAKRARA